MEAHMTWDPYDPPDAFRNTPRETYHQEPPVDPAKARAVAVALVGIVLLAIALTIAASAQETTTGTGASDTGQQAQEQQSQEAQPAQEAQPGATTLMQSEPEAQATDEVAARPLDGQIVTQAEGTYAASDLIGQPVISAEGEAMGTIADLLVTEDNQVAGVMIGIGGFLGFGEQIIAVEIDQLARAPATEGGERLLLNYTRAELEQAPEFVSLAEQLRQQEAEQARQELGAGTQQPPAASQPLTQ
jgi:sporulation protein YlmC with PRC-barrel domain